MASMVTRRPNEGDFGRPSKRPRIQLKEWNSGLFSLELSRHSIFPSTVSKNATGNAAAPLMEGTFHGTQMAITKIYSDIEDHYTSYFQITGLESSIPRGLTLDEKQTIFIFSSPKDKYPPHLNLIPKEDQTSKTNIFDAARLMDIGELLIPLIPERIVDWAHGTEAVGTTIADIEFRNKTLRSEKKDIFDDSNIGDRADWYTDAVFAQQQFTGTNPTTIRIASAELINGFKKAAKSQSLEDVYQLISSDLGSLFVQDYSYFRSAVGATPGATLKSNDGKRWLPAAVGLFKLYPDGRLHPLAIVIDYKMSLENSVVLFNRRLDPNESRIDQSADWPWRFAKTALQVSDWTRHELAIHLTNTHFVEEAVIVGAHRAFPTGHPVYNLLKPHWLKTLSLNAAAREVLVPKVILRITGLSDDQTYAFIRHAYDTFDWTGLYVPNDLKNRGFPEHEINSDPKFHNYGYARNIGLMWQVIRNFVAAIISADYPKDSDVKKDSCISQWTQEMRSPTSGAAMKSFPDIKTVDELIDAVTMCIHTASPQHTAVNYLQDYYQSFVISRPPSLCAAPPSSLKVLQGYKEADLLKALPVKDPHQWLLASHLPHLLSFRVAEDQNLLNYAASFATLAEQSGDEQAHKAGVAFLDQLNELTSIFTSNSKELDDQVKPYDVMDPAATAVSILI